ncbi:PREDICTED: uncharacterized protein LOC109462150 [Branchiostoma belcheri]|uniref:Uncharacterized protein LOC109462150 n=1 Tax=Branchiostoma belcheri TaxID=7741 RepID=A0A6P4Y662_BRABE|nr:PREDICTED: uncharacterized protein LOC109462150 [Branchiostoma belcheri]
MQFCICPNSAAESHQENTEPKRRRASKAKESCSAPKRPGKQRQEASSPVEKGPDNSLTAVEEDVPVFDLSSQTAQESATSDGEVRRRKQEEEESSRASKKQKDQDKTVPKKVPGVKKQPLVVEMVDSDDEDDDLFCMKRFRVNLTNRQNTSTESQATKEPNAGQIRTKNTTQQPAKKAKGDGQNDETAKNKKKGRPRKSAGKKNKDVDSEIQPESMSGSKQSAKDLEMRQEQPETQECRLDTVVDDVQREGPSVEVEVTSRG